MASPRSASMQGVASGLVSGQVHAQAIGHRRQVSQAQGNPARSGEFVLESASGVGFRRGGRAILPS